MSRVLEKLLPYEKPRLAAITVKSDADDSPRTQLDLTVLTDAELDTMEKLCLKGATGHTADITSRKPPEPRRATSGACVRHSDGSVITTWSYRSIPYRERG
jgi:hypothetical protein